MIQEADEDGNGEISFPGKSSLLFEILISCILPAEFKKVPMSCVIVVLINH